MTQRISGQAIATSYYDDMPLSLVLFRFLWPFWLLKDASSGDRLSRAAAYRHNRDMRIYLPGYLMKWLVSCLLSLGMTMGLGGLAGHGETSILTLLAAGSGMAFAGGVCVWVVTAYIYVFLSRHES